MNTRLKNFNQIELKIQNEKINRKYYECEDIRKGINLTKKPCKNLQQ